MEEIFGYIERLTFHNPETGFTVAQLIQRGQRDPTCMVGTMHGIHPGETVRCYGHWRQHLVHGRQFELEKFDVEAPADIVGIRKYLGSGLVKGIGSRYAEKIVDLFGTDTLHVIEHSPDRLLEVPGLGKKRVDKIKECWTDQKSIRDVMIFLQGQGLSPAFAQKIFKTYGSSSVAKVKENPYYLAKEVFGIGFKTADSLAQKMGIEKDSSKRLDAGIEFLLYQLSHEGHACFPVKEFLINAEKVLETSQELIEQRLEPLRLEGEIEVSTLFPQGQAERYIWSKKLFLSEIGIARELHRLTKAKSLLREIDSEKAVQWAQTQLNISLAPMQKEAVSHAISSKIHVVTGGPGTGKSTITNAILQITKKLTDKIMLAAPTGRAAKRMAEITHHPAKTIHSWLEYDFKAKGFKRNRDNPLDCDLMIVDEASMIDTYLMYQLLKAIPDTARVVFVGDINQLPSVGPGNVLKDLIASLTVSVTTLNEIYRQAAGSHIITNAHRVNHGLVPVVNNSQNSDFFFVEAEEPQKAFDTIVKLVSFRLPQRYGFNAMSDIQVLAPMKKGMIGIDHLNQALQGILNPQGASITRGWQKFQVGDKVMQTRNDYTKEVFNGDIGIIREINPEDQQVAICFDEREIIYEFQELDDMVLAYAISIHKFQGSECPCVVIPVHTSHFMLLHRNLLYTGITRGKKLVVLVGSKKALHIAVQRNDVLQRHTGLKQALMDVVV